MLYIELKRACIGLTLLRNRVWGRLNWAAGSRIGLAIVIVFLFRSDLSRMTETVIADYMPIWRQSASLTVAATAPVALLMAVNNWSEHTSLPAIFAAIAIGVAAWATGLWLLRHPLFVEAQRVGQHLLTRYARRA